MEGIFSQIGLYVKDFAGWLQKFTGSETGMPDIGYNGLIIVFVVFVVLLIGFSLGKSRMLLALVSLYVAAFIDTRFIYFEQLQDTLAKSGLEIEGFAVHIGFFLIVFAGVILILSHSFLKTKLTLSEASTLSVFLLGFLGIGFLASIFVGYIPDDTVLPIPETTIRYLGSPEAQFVWTLLPIVGVMFLKKEDN
ncbi:MAG: hypothetical protein ABH833_01760 [Parcubacteria group bacterium]